MALLPPKELHGEKTRFYLKIITEAISLDSYNNGSLRKSIWNYCLRNYSSEITFYEFLLAINKLLKEGKLANHEGIFTIPDPVILEVQQDIETIVKTSRGDISPI